MLFAATSASSSAAGMLVRALPVSGEFLVFGFRRLRKFRATNAVRGGRLRLAMQRSRDRAGNMDTIAVQGTADDASVSKL